MKDTLARDRVWLLRAGVLVLAVVVIAVLVHAASSTPPAAPAGQAVNGSPPSRHGYFPTLPAGAWSSLPGDRTCAARVHRSPWEPRPANRGPNHYMPDRAAVHVAFAARGVSEGRSADTRWDTWLLQRVDGHYTGTTDEIIQWAACKWGISDNLLRAIADRESTWYASQVTTTGRCVTDYGCGDMVSSPSKETRLFCQTISRYGHNYQADYGPGRCPETFGLTGVKSWEAPSWGRMPGNQNGTFPFNRDSTAFAADYLGAHLRGCLEGWEWWLDTTGTKTYTKGQLWGCVGAWYAGAWHTQGANSYIRGVRRSLTERVWLERGWPDVRPHCPPGSTCTGSRPPRNPSS